MASVKTSQFAHLSWGLSRNAEIPSVIDATYGWNPSYFPYLDDLVSQLVQSKVTGIQEKIADANDLSKFLSAVSELEIARILVSKGKQVELLSDSAWSGPSPDMITRDAAWNQAFVEVKRITDAEAAQSILNRLREFLKGKPFRLDLQLSYLLSKSSFVRSERDTQNVAATASFEEFVARFNPQTPERIQTKDVTYTPVPVSGPDGYSGFVTGTTITMGQELVKKFYADAAIKNAKRSSWKSKWPSVPYVVAFDCEDVMFDDVTVTQTFYGNTTLDPNRIYPDVSTHPEVIKAVAQGWEPYLKEKGILFSTATQCYLPTKQVGWFLRDRSLSSVSAILVRRGPLENIFCPNPFCDSAMNNPSFASYFTE